MVIDVCKSTAPISADQLGTNLGIWYDVTTPSLPGELAQVHAHILRWPGGSLSDTYHWQTHTQCNGSGSSYTSGPADSPNSTFDNFMNSVALPGGYDVAITVDYGTNPACNGGGDPAQAAAWVSYVKNSGWDSKVKYWTVGNEEFGGWEVDLHAKPHDPATYVAAMSGPNGYYALMKAADPKAQVGVVVDGANDSPNWDSTVLSQAPYDYVEVHWYAQQPGQESDSYLLNQAPADFTQTINLVKSELAAAGRPNTPIMVGEVNSVAYAQGKQTVSIVNGLFAAQILVAGIQDGLAVDTWWFGVGGTQGCGNNNSSSLYGFQNWGGYDLVFGNTANYYNDCNSGGPIVPEGTLTPSGQAFRLVSDFAKPGESLLSVATGASDVKAYAATQGSGYTVLLVNLNENSAKTMQVMLDGASASSYTATQTVYGKAQYDTSANNVWTGPVTTTIGTVKGSVSVTLPPWSISLLTLQ